MGIILLSQLKTSLSRVKTYIDDAVLTITNAVTELDDTKMDKTEIEFATDDEVTAMLTEVYSTTTPTVTPNVTTADDGKYLVVKNGAWVASDGLYLD